MVDHPTAPTPTNSITVETYEDDYNCAKCHMKFLNKDDFKRHNQIIHTKRFHLCPHCDKTFLRRDRLKIHIDKSHSNILKCPICSLEFEKRSQLSNHIKSFHSNIESLSCPECSIECDSLSSLEKHRQTHLSLAPHLVCRYCSKTFKRRDFYLRHIRSIHECSKCSEVFERKHLLSKHCREKHLMTKIINKHGVVEVEAIRIINDEDTVLSDSD